MDLTTTARKAIEAYGGSIPRAAAALEVSPSTIYRRIEAHVLTASRLHGDDTTVPVLAKGKTDTGRLWVYVRDDVPFAGRAPPAS